MVTFLLKMEQIILVLYSVPVHVFSMQMEVRPFRLPVSPQSFLLVTSCQVKDYRYSTESTFIPSLVLIDQNLVSKLKTYGVLYPP